MAEERSPAAALRARLLLLGSPVQLDSEAAAASLDTADPLRQFRAEFALPTLGSLGLAGDPHQAQQWRWSYSQEVS